VSHTAEPPVLVRAEDHLDVPVGAVLTDEDGNDQVFIGWRRNTVGHEMMFVRPYVRDRAYRRWDYPTELFVYHASMLDTLLRKFPKLKDFQK
jgi:glutamate-1-semialdehyde aminotransferase